MNGTAAQVLKHSFLYSFAATQPFAVYVDAYPALENKLLIESEKLNYGEHSQVVRLLQEKLSHLSYYKDPIDGEFDVITEHALKKFQKDFDIDVTGLANPQTVHAVVNAEKKKLLSKVENLTESINIQMQSEEVETVQEVMQYFGYYEGEIDGIYGPLTENALKTAEENHNIELLNNLANASLKELYESEEKDNEQNEVTVNDSQSENAHENEDTTKNENEDDEQETVKSVQIEGANDAGIIETAQSLVGTPYVWGGDSPGGFDCSGFIHYVYQTRNITVPRTVSDVWNFGEHVDNPSVGDLVFFETYKAGPSHMGIYLGNNKFIHAGESRGVEVSEMSNSYWRDKYIGAKRIN